MSDLNLHDLAPPRKQFLEDVVGGLNQSPKSLPCKYLYDERGSRLFDEICQLDEYYLTRTELKIMRGGADEMADAIGPGAVLVELGSGSSLKTRILLERLQRPLALIPVDISKAHLKQATRKLAQRYPDVLMRPVCADFTEPFDLPRVEGDFRRRVIYFPGSTIGNFGPPEAAALLKRMATLAEEDGGLLIGVDLQKSRDVLEAAYNDRRGVTEAFNLNLLSRINLELDGNFALERFRHEAVYNPDEGRVEMHLVSEVDQTVRVDDAEFEIARGESIHTENSYKYSLAGFAELASRAGFRVERVWCDDERLFSVQYLSVQ